MMGAAELQASHDGTTRAASWWRAWWPEIAIVALAALVRFWRLDYHSFWFDEAVSLDWAEDNPAFIWANTFPLLNDKHPPAYYLLLHYWQKGLALFGLEHSDVALRSLGAILGVLTVLGVLLLARRLSGRATGLLAGALVALSPVLVWYSQELRMFQPATTGVVWAAYCLARGWQGATIARRLGWWIGLIAAFTFALYSYLFSAFLLPAAGLTLLGLWWLATRPAESDPAAPPLRRFLEGSAALAITGALFLPLAINAWLVNDSEGQPGQAFMNFAATLARQVHIFTVWRAGWPEWWVTAALVFFGLLVAAGLVWPVWATAPGTQRHDRLWLWLWIGTPLLIGNLLLAVSDTVFNEDRYFLFLAPFVLWAAARGAIVPARRWRPAAWLTGGAACVLLAGALPALWSPAMLREDWRAAAGYIAAYEGQSPGLPGAVLSHVDFTSDALKWYLRPARTEEETPLYFPFGGTLQPEDAESVVAPPILGIQESGAETLWLVQSHLDGVDDSRVVHGWLGQHYPVITEQYPTGIQLTGFALRHRYDALPELGAGAALLDVDLAPGMRLLACEIMTPRLSATDERMHPPSGWVHVRLWWQAIGAIDQDYFPSVQMVGPEGVWGDRLYRDGEVLRRDPPSTWPQGTIVRDEVDINLNPVTPAGTYPVRVGLRDSAGADVGSPVTCGTVVVE